MELCDQELSWAREALAKVGLFNSCIDSEIQELLSGMEKKHFSKGSTILFQGEISNKLYLIENGLVQVMVRSGKSSRIVAELGANSYFGEISLLTPRAATATIKCIQDCDIVFLPGEVVQDLVKKNSVLAKVVNEKIEERLKAQNITQEGEAAPGA